MATYHISGVPITDEAGKLVGILTNRDLRFERPARRTDRDLMTSREPRHRADRDDARTGGASPRKHKIEKLPIVDEDGRLKGLITVKDIQKKIQYPDATKDEQGRLRVGAAVGVGQDAVERAAALIEEEVDVLVVDTAHGHSQAVAETVRALKERFDVQIVAGNIATREAAEALIEAGADAVKVGIGPGSICTTRIVAGIGRSADHGDLRLRAGGARSTASRSIADGGMQYSGDMAKALACRRGLLSCSAACSPVSTRARARSSSTRASASRSTAGWARSAR